MFDWRSPFRALGTVRSEGKARRFMEQEERRYQVRAHLLALATTVLGLLYFVWIVETRNRAHPYMSAAFLAAEVTCLLLFIVSTMSVWRLRHKPPDGLLAERIYGVDVFLPVCGEPISVVLATFRGAARIRWGGPLSVYVLDDGASEAVRSLSAQHGFTYLSRVEDGSAKDNAKAGNLNFGLSKTNGELILVMDADQVPSPNILEALAGYMRFPKLAFIQSAQSFWVPKGDPFFNQDRVFYGAVQLGFESHDAPISCGSGVLYRRAALQEVGGFATWNIVEDLTTSYELHSHGWKSFYYPYELSKGLAPADIWGVYRQRGQWALDTMRLLYFDNPLFKRGLSWSRRVNYLLIALSYLCAGLAVPFLFTIPIWTYTTGYSILQGPEWEFVVLRGLYFVAMALAMRLLFRKNESGRQFQALVGLFPMYVLAAVRALAYPHGKRPKYVITNQVKARRRFPLPAVVAVLPQLVLILANAVLPFYALFTGSAAPRLVFINIFISGVAIWTLLPMVLAALMPNVWILEENPHEGFQAAPQPQS
jgi:cellulose synthase (UDP-forming)